MAATTLHFGIPHLIIASALCLGIYKAFQPEMVFHYFGYLISNKLPEWVRKVTIGCPPCMASLYGSLFYVSVIGLDWQIILFVVCLSGLNFFVSQFFTE